MAIAIIITVVIIIICKLTPNIPKPGMTPQSHSGLLQHTVSARGDCVHDMTAQSHSSLMQHADGGHGTGDSGSHLVLQQGSSSLLQH